MGGETGKKSQAAASCDVPAPCLAQDWMSRPANAGVARAVGVIMCLADKWASFATPSDGNCLQSPCFKVLTNDP